MGAEVLPRLLLVEDNPGDAKLVEVRLRGEYEVVWTQSLSEAMGKLAPVPAVALVDLGLPDVEGMEVLQALRAALPEVPLVVLTGQDDDAVGEASVRAGAQDYLVKDDVTQHRLLRALRYASERKALDRFRERLHHADRLSSLGQLAAGVAHEINNPATVLSSNTIVAADLLAELRERLGADGQRGRVLEIVEELSVMHQLSREGLDRIRSVVRDLGTFARVEDGGIESLDLGDAVRAALNLTKTDLRHRARVEQSIEPVPQIAARKGRLIQVFVNLLLNAAQALPTEDGSGNVIRISVHHDRGSESVVAEVADTGCGIAPERVASVFEPFYTTKPPGEGTGLGLSLCLEIVRQHRGRIDVDSEPGVGTTFRVRIPRETGLSVKTSVEPPEGNLVSPARLRLMLVDDDDLVRSSLGRLLARRHEVEAFADADAALQHLADDPGFDVIVCDLMMPGLDGVGFHAALRTSMPDLLDRVVFVSGGAITPAARRFVATERVTVLDKPVSSEALRVTVARIARRRGRVAQA